MTMRFLWRWTAAFVLLAATATAAAAQTSGVVTGTVTDVDSGSPLPSVRVEVRAGTRLVAGGFTDDAGRYRLPRVAPGLYAVTFDLVGYASVRVDSVLVEFGRVAVADAALRPVAFNLNPVVVTASRRQEKSLDAPATVAVVDQATIQARPVLTVADHVRGLPGVDIATTGLIQHAVVTRGFNNVFAGDLLTLTDYRYAHVPSLGINAYYLIPAANEDIERMEILLGPGSALYGPNTSSGVMHIMTRPPFGSEGATMSLAGGGRSLVQGSFRVAETLGNTLGIKASGQYMEGHDWDEVDSLYLALDDKPRDYRVRRVAGETRVDLRTGADTEMILSTGGSVLLKGLEMTPLGPAQALNWRYGYVQGRFRSGRLFAQAFANFADTEQTYLVWTTSPMVDRSRLFAFQFQHGFDMGERQTFTYGLDAQTTEPRTEGTINGRNEDDDRITEAGAYVHSESRLLPWLDIVAAARVDYHNRMPDAVFSPRAALVFKPGDGHNLRLTYNRAFNTPTTHALFLDVLAVSLPGAPFGVRAIGVPETGLHFRRDCESGLCMRSPYADDPSALVEADATRMWQTVVGIALERGVDLRRVPPPGPDDVATEFRLLNAAQFRFETVTADDLGDIEPIRPSVTDVWELGYKGMLGDNLLLAGDVYFERRWDFQGPLVIETPNVFFEPGSLEAYLIQNGMSEEEAREAALLVAGQSGSSEHRGIPVGTITPDHPLTATPDMYLTFRNFGSVEFWGADVSATLLLGNSLSLRGSYSYTSKNFFAKDEIPGGLTDVAMNTPKHKGRLAIEYRNEEKGLQLELRGRYVDEFPMNSGVFIGPVHAYGLVDALVGVDLPFLGRPTLSVDAQNIFDNRHEEFIGAPKIGRLIVTRIRYEF